MRHTKKVKSVTVEPALSTLTPDSANMAQVQVTFNVPGKYFSKRSRLVISPQLIVEDSVLDEYEPLVLDAPIYSKKSIARRYFTDTKIRMLDKRLK